jgi:hypothetical protein
VFAAAAVIIFFLTTGEFKVRLPDGRLQVTSYQADDQGFRPKISYEIDPLFVPPPPAIGFTPEPKFIRRPPPRDYEAPELKYLPPTINYDPRTEGRPVPTLLTPAPPAHSYAALELDYAPPPASYAPPPASYAPPPGSYAGPTPTPARDVSVRPRVTYLPPALPQPPKRYSVPDIGYDPRQQHDTSPLINYRPRDVDNYGNYISPDIYTPSSIERHDIPDREVRTLFSNPIELL